MVAILTGKWLSSIRGNLNFTIFLIPILFIVFLLVDPCKAEREAKANREWDRWVNHIRTPKYLMTI